MTTRLAVVAVCVAMAGLLTACSGSGKPASGPAAASLPLGGTFWRVVSVDGEAVKPDPTAPDRAAHLVFDTASTRVGGSGGVNRMVGGYTLDGNALKFKPMAQTQMAGPPEQMASELKLNRALEKVVRYEIAGSTLKLLSGSGETLVVLEGTAAPSK